MSMRARFHMRSLLAGASLAALAAGQAAAGPVNGVITNGAGPGANINAADPANVVVTQTSDRMAIQWDSFSIANGESVTFTQPGNQSIALNKVVGSGGPIPASVIDGVMQANGHVWLVNPSGIAFGANANVDVGGLLATTADINPGTFVASDPATDTFTFAGGGTGTVVNAGDIDAQGLVALVAPVVTNSGDLTSSHGDVLMAGAESFRLRFTSTPRNNGAPFNELLVTDFIIDGGSTTAAAGSDVVHQTATGRAVGGRVIANASRVGGGAFLNMEGLVEAQSVGATSGDVVLLGGSDITAGAIGATATDAVKTDNMTIVAPGTASVQGTAVTIGNGVGPLSTGGGVSSTGTVAITGTTGDVAISADIQATSGDLSVQAANGDIDVAELIAQGSIDVSGRDIDLANGNTTGATTVLRTSTGSLSLTATAGDISKTGGIVDVDAGTDVTLSGNVTGATTAWVIDNVPGTVTADDFDIQFLRIGSTGDIGIGDVTASQSAEAISSGGTLKVGNVSSDNNITLSGTDVDLTGAGGSVQSTGGAVSITASGAGPNNISSTGAIDIDGDSVALTGPVTGTAIDIDADNGGVTADSLQATVTDVSIDATGDIDVDDVTALAHARVVSSAGAVDVGNVNGNTVTVSGTDVDLTGAGGIVQASGGLASVAATGGAGHDVSAADALRITGASVAVTGDTAAQSIRLEATAGGLSAGKATGSTGAVEVTATGNIDMDDVSAATIARVESSGGAVDVGNVGGSAGVTISGTDIDLTGTGGFVQAPGAAVSITASGGGGSNISSTGPIDIDGDSVALSGPLAGASVDIDAANGTVTGNAISATGGSVAVDATQGIDVDDVSATTTVHVASSTDSVDVGNVTGPGGVTLFGDDIDLTGAGGSVQASGGTVSITSRGGGTATSGIAGIDIDGDAVVLSGDMRTPGPITIDADTGNISTDAAIESTGGLVSIVATAGNALLTTVDAATSVLVRAQNVTTTGAVTGGTSAVVEATNGNVNAGGVVTGTAGQVTVTATNGDVDLPGAQAGTTATIAGNDVDLTGPVSAGGAASVTASAGDISSAGTVDVTGSSVAVSGPVNGATGVVLTGTGGGVSADAALTSATGAVAVTATGDLDVTTAAGATGVTLSGADVDVTGPVNGGTGTATLTAATGDVSSTGTLDVDAAAISLGGTVTAGAGIDLDATNGGITATGALNAPAGAASLNAVEDVLLTALSALGDISIVADAIGFTGHLASQGQVFLNALTGNIAGTGSVAAPAGNVTAVAPTGQARLNDVTGGGDLSVRGGTVLLTGTSVIGGKATLEALLGNVEVAGSLNALGGIMLIDAPSGSAVINRLVSDSEITFAVLDLDLNGSLSAGDKITLGSGASNTTIVLGGDGGTGGLVLRRPQGFTLDAAELSRIEVRELQFDARANDLALLDVAFDPALVDGVMLGADPASHIFAGGSVQGLGSLQLGFMDATRDARPELIFVSGALGRDTATGRLGSVRLESSGDIVIGTQAFREAFDREKPAGGIHLADLAEPNLAGLGGVRDHVFITADKLQLVAPGEIAQLNTGTGASPRGIVIRTTPDGTILPYGAGPERVNLFGVIIRPDGTRATSFDAGLEDGLLAPGLFQHGELRFNLCVIGDSTSCSNAILREAQESARSRNSDLSSLTNTTALGFERNEFEDEEEESDLGGVAGAGNEGLWGVGLR